MNRRDFVLNTSLAAAALPFTSLANQPHEVSKQNSDRLLNAYYLRAHMYTMVPHQVREDLKWMRDAGTDIVSIGILEQDLYAAVENVEIICNEAEKLGMSVYAIPSRWGGMFAGAPKVPSIFTSMNPQTWILEENGKPFYNARGPISSVHYPEVFEFFCDSIEKTLNLWNIKGMVWDEPKSYRMDYSPLAIEKLGMKATLTDHIKAVSDFHSKIMMYIKHNFPNIVTCLFNYASIDDDILRETANVDGLDYFGADGRPWRPNNHGTEEKKGKTLLGNGERHIKIAHELGKKSLWLIENHNLPSEDIGLMRKRMPEVLQQDINQLIYYYYPRNLDKPYDTMKALSKFLKDYKN